MNVEQIAGKQKTPLLRGSCFNPLGGVYFNSTIFLFAQTLQLVSDIDKYPHSLVTKSLVAFQITDLKPASWVVLTNVLISLPNRS
jgi:hypothetical protein